MKHATVALAVLLLAMAASPALADSVPVPPITSVSFSGATSGTFFNFPNTYLGSSNIGAFCPANCMLMDVQVMPDGSFGTQNFAEVYGFGNAPGLDGLMFGHLGKVSLNAQTDVLSGIFGGKEQMVAFVNGKWFPYDWYTVKGTFTENLGTGAGTLTLNSEKFIGTTAVPEPGTLLTLGTGLCAMAGVVRRKLRTV
jgi:hypothetical protein